jgi:hypothetical protein
MLKSMKVKVHTLYEKKKCKAIPGQVLGVPGGSLINLNFCNRWKRVVRYIVRVLYQRGMNPLYVLNRSLGGPPSRSGNYAASEQEGSVGYRLL